MTRWRWAGLAAAVTLATGIGFGFIPGNDACPVQPGMPPWGAFQKVATVAEAQAYLTGACTGAMRSGMWFDALVFIPVYVAFLLLTARAARATHIVALSIIALLAVGAIADEVEGLRLLAVIDAQGGTAAMITAANAASWTKELFLALATLVVGIAVFSGGGWRRIAGAVAIVGAAGAAVAEALAYPGTLGLAFAWLTLAVTTWVMALRGALKGSGS